MLTLLVGLTSWLGLGSVCEGGGGRGGGGRRGGVYWMVFCEASCSSPVIAKRYSPTFSLHFFSFFFFLSFFFFVVAAVAIKSTERTHGVS